MLDFSGFFSWSRLILESQRTKIVALSASRNALASHELVENNLIKLSQVVDVNMTPNSFSRIHRKWTIVLDTSLDQFWNSDRIDLVVAMADTKNKRWTNNSSFDLRVLFSDFQDELVDGTVRSIITNQVNFVNILFVRPHFQSGLLVSIQGFSQN
ncbi:hypothetical protein PGUG_04890 [Meyerozyma guilliermondii ATCC 6260]|uniref:Uncharacterized protein n=1 Tax=Meyerozyma guilliermondii (strain ATCC 6260 / CBS 566 / DSM 6381 / JCM 1539 / NBRC 10279 / NRRL Y-324) TaxID=294746 RepID=A5DNN9_PICGU|nr:uncharacterized protein PGUG_04890 [Meyerozyma guilliermondii ATCC 6260]EDK40791.2 hypothetical protein PGUG_04890 [Meyerozyma guilliermondii ATCC 6260]